MNKKIIFVLSLLFMISFSTGIFAQIISTDQVSITQEDLSFWNALFSSIKSDLITIVVTLLLSTSAYLLPCTLLFMTGKVFALGFSAAYLLASHPQGFSILCAVLLPRGLIRIPAYMALLQLAFIMAKSKGKRKSSPSPWLGFAFCGAVLFFASLIEVCLLQLTVSP